MGEIIIVLKAMASRKSTQISDVGSTVWKEVKHLVGFKLEPMLDLFDATKYTE